MESTGLEHDAALNRAGRRAAARRGRKLAALSSGALLAGGAGAAVMSALSATPAGALTTHTVNLLGDAGDGTCDITCTLRDAIDDASNDGDDSAITFAGTVTGTITLTGGDLEVAGGTDSGFDLTITGPGATVLTVENDGSTVDRIFNADSNFGAATLSISGLRLEDGLVSGDGGAVNFYNNGGDLTLTNMVLDNNRTTASTSNRGGAIGFYAADDLTITNSTISGNYSNAGNGNGGGVYFRNSGDMTVTNSRITGNQGRNGGGIFFYDSNDLMLTGSTVSGNSGSQGGGVDFYQSADLTVTNSTISNNDASTRGAGLKLYNSTSMTITNSTISGNQAQRDGGGVMFYQGNNSSDAAASLTITNSTISGNSTVLSGDGAGIQFYEADGEVVDTTMTITGSTISGNTAFDDGGGLYFYGDTATIANTTIAGNSAGSDGGGIGLYRGDFTLLQSTISGNTAGGDAVDFGDGVYLRGPGGPVNLVADAPAKDGDPDKPGKHAGSLQAKAVGAATADMVTLTGTIVSGNGTADIESQSTASVNSTASLWGTKGAGITVTDLGGTINSSAPLLGALANNGGPTQTMKLLTASPALDTGPTTVPTFTGNGFDQRGAGFPRVVNGRVDIGAYEAALEGLFTG